MPNQSGAKYVESGIHTSQGLRPWAPRAVVLYGALTSALIVALGPILNLDPSGRRGLLSGALVVLLGCIAAAWLLRRSVVTF